MKKFKHLDHLMLRRLKRSSASSSSISTYNVIDELTKQASDCQVMPWVLMARRLQVMRKLHWISFDKSTGLWSITAIGKIQIEDNK